MIFIELMNLNITECLISMLPHLFLGGGLQFTKTGGVGATKIVNFWKPTQPNVFRLCAALSYVSLDVHAACKWNYNEHI